jgi:hypothetical protein
VIYITYLKALVKPFFPDVGVRALRLFGGLKAQRSAWRPVGRLAACPGAILAGQNSSIKRGLMVADIANWAPPVNFPHPSDEHSDRIERCFFFQPN